MSFKWIKPPTGELTTNLKEYEKRVYVAIHAAASYWGQHVQDQSRLNARWNDRTGNARSGLFYAVDGFGQGEVVGEVDASAKALMRETAVEMGSANTLVITLGHTVFYGKFLELSNGGRYAVILSEIEGNLSKLERMLRDIFM
jgi:hypothetical protein